jgi:signal transduction histidine kinase
VELHYNINQRLAGTKMFLGIVGNKNKEVKELIIYPMELLDSSMEEIRALCHKMVTPVKNMDLEELITDLVNKFDQATKIKTRFMYAVTDGILSDELQLNIFRIIRELVNNIHKYSGAKKVGITIKSKNRVIAITVTDDGKGFDPEKKRKEVSISNMINRVASFNGEVEIKSSEGNGCRTSINITY